MMMRSKHESVKIRAKVIPNMPEQVLRSNAYCGYVYHKTDGGERNFLVIEIGLYAREKTVVASEKITMNMRLTYYGNGRDGQNVPATDGKPPFYFTEDTATSTTVVIPKGESSIRRKFKIEACSRNHDNCWFKIQIDASGYLSQNATADFVGDPQNEEESDIKFRVMSKLPKNRKNGKQKREADAITERAERATEDRKRRKRSNIGALRAQVAELTAKVSDLQKQNGELRRKLHNQDAMNCDAIPAFDDVRMAAAIPNTNSDADTDTSGEEEEVVGGMLTLPSWLERKRSDSLFDLQPLSSSESPALRRSSSFSLDFLDSV
eukprot:g2836.t1